MQPMTASRPAAPRRDPAPSRWAYRMHRLWLTPLFRALLRVGVPAFLLVFTAGAYFANPDNREKAGLMVADLRNQIETRPEFMVKLMAIDGASEPLAEDIRRVFPVEFPISSFDLDLAQMQRDIEELAAVEDAAVRIKPGGVLELQITERIPAIVWRSPEGVKLLDREGYVVADIPARLSRPDLPLISGEGAADHATEALELLAVSAPIADRIRGLVRMGERRWDVALDRDQRILLPEEGAVAALERVIVLDHAKDMLARDLAVVDIRNASRPTIRLNTTAVEELRRIRDIQTGQNGAE
ncbi:cell division protein FtsQ/DivIB [Cognatishimia sp. MH4019]|uniref:cell division protein FtsQ/DivIB n=1 Tax=Cognatishimia sp. MH4019 TaxID=2854030 RepID=UPI001CD29B97|nr:cell division protein FtsQ/DivIB [Cognatishimia sp. MH4019]